jgi:hypothetical protein
MYRTGWPTDIDAGIDVSCCEPACPSPAAVVAAVVAVHLSQPGAHLNAPDAWRTNQAVKTTNTSGVLILWYLLDPTACRGVCMVNKGHPPTQKGLPGSMKVAARTKVR